jgi:hypothetical protein
VNIGKSIFTLCVLALAVTSAFLDRHIAAVIYVVGFGLILALDEKK